MTTTTTERWWYFLLMQIGSSLVATMQLFCTVKCVDRCSLHGRGGVERMHKHSEQWMNLWDASGVCVCVCVRRLRLPAPMRTTITTSTCLVLNILCKASLWLTSVHSNLHWTCSEHARALVESIYQLFSTCSMLGTNVCVPRTVFSDRWLHRRFDLMNDSEVTTP